MAEDMDYRPYCEAVLKTMDTSPRMSTEDRLRIIMSCACIAILEDVALRGAADSKGERMLDSVVNRLPARYRQMRALVRNQPNKETD